MLQYITVTRNEPKIYMRMTILFNGPRLSEGDVLTCNNDFTWRVDEIKLACENVQKAMDKLETKAQSYWAGREDYY